MISISICFDFFCLFVCIMSMQELKSANKENHVCWSQLISRFWFFFFFFFFFKVSCRYLLKRYFPFFLPSCRRQQWRAPFRTRGTKHSGSENAATQKPISHLIGVQLSTRPSQTITPGGGCAWPRHGQEQGQGWVKSDGLPRLAI